MTFRLFIYAIATALATTALAQIPDIYKQGHSHQETPTMLDLDKNRGPLRASARPTFQLQQRTRKCNVGSIKATHCYIRFGITKRSVRSDGV